VTLINDQIFLDQSQRVVLLKLHIKQGRYLIIKQDTPDIKLNWVALGLYREWWSFTIGWNMAT